MRRHMTWALVGAVLAAQAAWAGGACGKAGKGCGADKAASCASKAKCGSMKAKDCHAPAAADYGTIDTAGLKALLGSKVPAVVVDARTEAYDNGQRIPGAVWLPADSSDEAIQQALPSKDALVIAYCSNLKCPASANLAHKLAGMGYPNVLKYPEGLDGWIKAGQEVTGTKKSD